MGKVPVVVKYRKLIVKVILLMSANYCVIFEGHFREYHSCESVFFLALVPVQSYGTTRLFKKSSPVLIPGERFTNTHISHTLLREDGAHCVLLTVYRTHCDR